MSREKWKASKAEVTTVHALALLVISCLVLLYSALMWVAFDSKLVGLVTGLTVASLFSYPFLKERRERRDVEEYYKKSQ